MFKKIKLNWKAGITVSLVSIPLSVSLAVASQASPIMGIITAIWAGLIASFFGGSNYNIVGPTGALSGILATYAITQGADLLPMLAIITGIFILLAYLLKLEKYLIFVPASTIHGFTLGVAFIIGLNQFNSAFGLQGLTLHDKFIENIFESFQHIQYASLPAIIVFSIFLIGLFIFQKVLPKFPGSIILAPVGILLGYLSVNQLIPLRILTLGDKYPSIEPVLFQLPKLTFNQNMLIPALTIAIVAILETMISAKIADGMTKTKHNKRKEMLGLSLANIASGLAGGIPATAALARTSLNIKTGATDKISATINTISIVTISYILLSWFKYIPMAVIAAILVFVAMRMVETQHFVKMFKLDKVNFAISMFVAFITIYEDPIVGLLLGTAISLLIFIEKLSKGQFELIINNKNEQEAEKITGTQLKQLVEESHTIVYSIKGQLAYINGQAHIARFENQLSGYENVILRMRELYFIDLDGIEAFDEIIEILETKHKQVYVSGVNELIEKALATSPKYLELVKSGHVVTKTSDVLIKLGFKIS